MNPKILGRPVMDDWVGAVIRGYRVHGPQARGDHFVYDRLRSPAQLRLDHDVTALPPKKYLVPSCEPLVQFARSGQFQSILASEPLVLFGVHPYDVAAIAQMDRYFSQDQIDTHYQARRKNLTIVACDVQTASPNVFAACMGTASVHEGFDVLLTLVGDTYIAESRTPAGDALLALADDPPDAEPISLARREQVWLDAERLLRRHNLRCRPQDLPGLLDKAREHPVWRRKSQACFCCASCVMVCPCCFCFDVQDEVNWDLASGTRSRHWDSCLLAEFALVAGGHNFRRQREERYRYRFYRKGKYLPERYGFAGCVGCGRCVGACVSGVANPVELYNSLLEG
jgi:hypothetical protein